MRISRRSIAGEKTGSPNRKQSLGSHFPPRLFLNEALANGAQHNEKPSWEPLFPVKFFRLAGRSCCRGLFPESRYIQNAYI